VNTTARLEELCKELGAQCLASGVVCDGLTLPPYLEARSVGDVELKGRGTPLPLFEVRRR
jgi:class 3 adenylate cyclase